MFPLQIIAGFIPFIGLAISLVLSLVSLAALALVIIGMINAKDGKLLRSPINFRLIK